MKTFCTSTLSINQYILTSNVDGVAITIYVSNLTTGDGYNSVFMDTLRDTIKYLESWNKDVSIGIIFGEFCTQSIYSQAGYVEFVKSHHKGSGPKKPIKLPCFYNDAYLTILSNLISWFATELKKDSSVYDVIESVKITGCNESTLEMRATSQDWSLTSDTQQTYVDAATKWLAAGYTYDKALSANCDIIDMFTSNFTDKTLILPYIGGLNGFCCVNDKNEICLPKNRPNLTDTILKYSNKVTPQYTAFNSTTIVAPNSHQQINKQMYGTPKYPFDDRDFKLMLNNAQAQQVENLEVHPLCVLHYPQIFQ